MSPPFGYLITYTSYGARLHGDERGTVERLRTSGGGTRILEPEPLREKRERDMLLSEHAILNAAMRTVIAEAVVDVCVHREWLLRAVNVRTNHVHVVVAGRESPEAMMNAFKAWSTRRLRELGLAAPQAKLWTRHGSTSYLWDSTALAKAVAYVVDGQGEDLGGVRVGAVTDGEE
jgi:REP element-mobilizing transposase RayT